MSAITSKFKGFVKSFRKDESAPTTIEWILLLVVALIVMVIIYSAVNWAAKDADKATQEVNTQKDKAMDAAKNAFSK